MPWSCPIIAHPGSIHHGKSEVRQMANLSMLCFPTCRRIKIDQKHSSNTARPNLHIVAPEPKEKNCRTIQVRLECCRSAPPSAQRSMRQKGKDRASRIRTAMRAGSLQQRSEKILKPREKYRQQSARSARSYWARWLLNREPLNPHPLRS